VMKRSQTKRGTVVPLLFYALLGLYLRPTPHNIQLSEMLKRFNNRLRSGTDMPDRPSSMNVITSFETPSSDANIACDWPRSARISFSRSAISLSTGSRLFSVLPYLYGDTSSIVNGW